MSEPWKKNISRKVLKSTWHEKKITLYWKYQAGKSWPNRKKERGIKKVQKTEIYAIEAFQKVYRSGMSKEELLNGEFENDLRQVLFAGSDEETTRFVFEQIEPKRKELKDGEEIRFYSFYKITYDKESKTAKVDDIDFKSDEIIE